MYPCLSELWTQCPKRWSGSWQACTSLGKECRGCFCVCVCVFEFAWRECRGGGGEPRAARHHFVKGWTPVQSHSYFMCRTPSYQKPSVCKITSQDWTRLSFSKALITIFKMKDKLLVNDLALVQNVKIAQVPVYVQRVLCTFVTTFRSAVF